MIEYRDGTFGNIEALRKVLEDAMMIPPEIMKAIHVGTEDELKTRKTIEQRLKALEEKLARKPEAVLKSDIIDIPRPEEIKRLLKHK